MAHISMVDALISRSASIWNSYMSDVPLQRIFDSVTKGDLNLIGQNIYRLRKQRGLTLSDLSDRTGISKSYLSNIERNLKQNPSIQLIEKIASVLQVDLKSLLKASAEADAKYPLDKEWLDFIHELVKTGIDKQNIHQYIILIEFMKWHNENKCSETP